MKRKRNDETEDTKDGEVNKTREITENEDKPVKTKSKKKKN